MEWSRRSPASSASRPPSRRCCSASLPRRVITFIYDMRNAAWSFAQQLRPQDYVALMTFDMRTQIVTDFTQDKRQLYNAINSLDDSRFQRAQSLRRAL